MWDGPRQGPRGGPPFRGDHRGDGFGGRDGPMSDFRGRDGMNMGPRGPLGPRDHDLPPMDIRRMEGDGRGWGAEPHDSHGREPNRDHFRRGEEPDFSVRRQFEISIREKMMNSSGFPGPGRNLDMGRRGLPPREPMRFMDGRDREMFRDDMPRFNNPDMDGRRTGFPGDLMGRNDGLREMRDRPRMGMDDIDGCNMDMLQRERGMMDFDRRGGPPFNTRGGFDSDMDFRNRPGPSAEFRGRERSPSRFGSIDGGPMEKGRPGIPTNSCGPNRPDRGDAPGPVGDREFSDAVDDPTMDYRSGEGMTLAEEWKSRRKEKNPFSTKTIDIGILPEPSFPLSATREGNLQKPLPFKEKDMPSLELPGKEVGFPHADQFAPIELPSNSRKGPQDMPFPGMGILPIPHGREKDGKLWLGDRDPKPSQNASNRSEKPLYHQEKNPSSRDIQGSNDRFKGQKDIPHDQGPVRNKTDMGPEFQSGNTQLGRDQDYRDIDYRTGSGRVFDYKHEEFQVPERDMKESKPVPPSKYGDSGSQDQDYRSASVKDKVSNTISIIGIPKTATMEQILGAFAVRDGVPMQGMKIKNVVPGYSHDTAYVEFLNLEDAVHFMESNKGSLKVGTGTVSMKYVQSDKVEAVNEESNHKGPQPPEPLLPIPGPPLDVPKMGLNDSKPKGLLEPPPQAPWQRSSDLTPEAWQQQVDQQLQVQEPEHAAEPWAHRTAPRPGPHQSDPIFKESKTMIIKNVKPTTTVETILKALDPFAYLDERNVRLVKGKPPGSKCFCFVDMDSHEQVTRLVELLTKPKPLVIDRVRVYAEVAKPLKNQSFRRDSDKPGTSLLGYPPEANMMEQQYSQALQYAQSLPAPPVSAPPTIPSDLMTGSLAGSMDPSVLVNTSYNQLPGVGYAEAPPALLDPSYQAVGTHVPLEAATGMAGMAPPEHTPETYVYGSETPDMTSYLYDATSGFYYDPQTTLYYDPSSRYFYNAQTQEYLYWDAHTKTYIPVPGGSSAETQPITSMAADVQAILSNPAADAPLEMKKPSEPKPANSTAAPPVPAQPPVPTQAPLPPPPPQVPVPGPTAASATVPSAGPTTTSEPESEPESGAGSSSVPEKREEEEIKKETKEEKPRSLAAFKIMKDMERWAKIQNRQKESVRSPSPVLKTGSSGDDKKASKAADAGFAIFERKGTVGDDLFKKPVAPPKKDEKSKRSIGSLGLLASDYAAGSDEEVEEEKHEPMRPTKPQSEDKEDKLTDWKKIACLLCRRQFPNKDALIRHQQLSDLHKQNMEIHLKIKRSKKELEALENQEKELSAKETTRSPEQKRRKQHHQPVPQHHHHHHSWAGGSRDSHKVSERPGLGAEPVERKKKEPVVWDHATYKQAVRKAMFARFKELE